MFLINQNLEMNMPQISKTKFILNFRKHKSRKKSLDLVEQNLVKLSKIEKTEELIAGN